MSDDMGYGDLSSYGGRDVRTPNIDSLARDGVRLTDFYANGSVCTPTRAALVSGRYQQRYAVDNLIPAENLPGGEAGLPVTGRSLPQVLRASGYATGLVGKWHLGYKPEFGPIRHGFDYFFGAKSGYVDYYQHTGPDGRPDLWENETPITEQGYMTDMITARSVKFIESHAGGPFFIDVAYTTPHWPYQVPDSPSTAPDNGRHVQPHESSTSTRAQYIAMMARMDRGVGEILRTLDRLGLRNNTIVIFTNDNGGEWLSEAAGLFSRKGTVWEGGIRVPALIRWPGHIPAGTVSGQVGITMDLYESILAATGTPAPEGPPSDGKNIFLPLEQRTTIPRTLFWRVGQGRAQMAVRDGDFKLVLDGGRTMLFDVRKDPGERQDLTNRNQGKIHDLRVKLDAWENDVNAEARNYQPAAPTQGPRGGGRGGRGGRGGAPGQ
jgi:arylsulfatase A-like enzyme